MIVISHHRYASAPAIVQRAHELIDCDVPRPPLGRAAGIDARAGSGAEGGVGAGLPAEGGVGARLPPTASLAEVRDARALAGVPLEARDVAQAARSGDAFALLAMGDAARALALACINITRLQDPHVIVFAGGVASHQLIDAVRLRMKDLSWTILSDTVSASRARETTFF